MIEPPFRSGEFRVEFALIRGETRAVIGVIIRLFNGSGEVSLCISSSGFLTFITVCEMRGVVIADVTCPADVSCSERKSIYPWLMVSLPTLREKVMMLPCLAFCTAMAKTAVISSLAISWL